MAGHRVEAVANEFLLRARREQRHLTNMQLQKLPYIAHGWSLGLRGEALVADSPKAYPYGPVYPQLYSVLKRYGSSNVTELIREYDGGAEFFGGARGEPIEEQFTDEEARLIQAVWDAYKNLHAFKLSEMTHQPDSPWTKVTEESGTYSTIPDALIRSHYEDLARRRRQAA